MTWINQNWDRNHWEALQKEIMKFQIQCKVRNLLTICIYATLLHTAGPTHFHGDFLFFNLCQIETMLKDQCENVKAKSPSAVLLYGIYTCYTCLPCERPIVENPRREMYSSFLPM
jgi:hypothetical protein